MSDLLFFRKLMDGRPPGHVDFGLILGKEVSEPLVLTILMDGRLPGLADLARLDGSSLSDLLFL